MSTAEPQSLKSLGLVGGGGRGKGEEGEGFPVQGKVRGEPFLMM